MKVFAPILAGVFLVILTACTVFASDEVAVYTIADGFGDMGYPSPYAHYARGPGYVRMSLIFDTLVWKDENGYVPALAESWEYLENENAYKFNLRDDVTWHDGQTFTADDVEFTFDYIQDHPYVWVDSGVVEQSEKTDDYTIKVYLSEPYAPFLEKVACTLPILPEHIYAEVDDPSDFKDDDDAVIGTGPYKLGDYNKAQGTYLFEANDDYYGGSPRIKKLIFVNMPSQTSPAALSQGSVNAASVPPEAVEQLQDAGLEIIASSYDWNAKLMINHQEEPFSDVEFRHALALAIDRQALIDDTQRGYALAGSPGMVPPDSDWYNSDVEQYDYDPSQAEEIIEDLGYDGEEVELLFGERGTSGWPGERVAQKLEQQLEAVGLDVTLNALDATTLDTKIKEGDYELALLGHGGLGADPDYLRMMTLDDLINSAKYYEDDELTDLLEDQVKETDEDDRRDMIYEAQDLYAQDLPALTIYYPNWYWAHDGQVDLFYTKSGIALGVPLPLNKLAFV